jgi:hypothetical protein
MAARAMKALDGSAANASLSLAGEEQPDAGRVVQLSSAAFLADAAQSARLASNQAMGAQVPGEVESVLPALPSTSGRMVQVLELPRAWAPEAISAGVAAALQV